MKKILLDLNIPKTRRELHTYLKEKMDFPDYYGKNLDALSDMLTSISEPTAVGLFLPVPEILETEDIDIYLYLDRVKEVFQDAEKKNSALAVICSYVPDMEQFPETDQDSEARWDFY